MTDRKGLGFLQESIFKKINNRFLFGSNPKLKPILSVTVI